MIAEKPNYGYADFMTRSEAMHGFPCGAARECAGVGVPAEEGPSKIIFRPGPPITH